jgi:Cellulase M and related proteins
VQHGGASHPGVVRMLEDAAGRADIALQHEATSVRTGTDTDSIFHQRKGIPSALVSIPLRYMHSPVEMAHLDDVRGVVDLMVEVLTGLDADAVGSVQGRVYRQGGS